MKATYILPLKKLKQTSVRAAVVSLLAGLALLNGQTERPDAEPFVLSAIAFADSVIEHGRDQYGPEHTPLFVDGLHAHSLKPVVWEKDGQSWVLSNFASQQALIRLLDGLSSITGESRFQEAALEATAYALKNLRSPNGLLYWAGHMAWDLEGERQVGQYPNVHEMKAHGPYYDFLWQVDPDRTRKLMETIWAAHILDWRLLDYNRHASTETVLLPQWDHTFAEDIAVPFPAQGNNLSFANVTPSLLYAGIHLAALDHNENALRWSRRLAWRWQQARHPETGLSGGQLSYRVHDRAQDSLGHVHPDINEAMIVATYHQESRYHRIPLVQLQSAEKLLKLDGPYREIGQELINWALNDLKVYAEQCYDSKSGTFVAKMINGTPLMWKEAKTDYYTPSSFAPQKPDGQLFWGYALAYRLSGDAFFWNMARELGKHLELGDIGSYTGTNAAAFLQTSSTQWHLIYALLEMHRASGKPHLLQLAARIGNNLRVMQTESGLFPRPGREYARTGDEIPLALLHLAAALKGRSAAMPAPSLDNQFLHAEFHAPLQEHQQKRNDRRTYDHYVFYGPQ
ncbi:MAG: hypothetical protein KJT03_07110 [Verrucomicrobiae bacterium]|nr:hypothetical protein [Verrucomicrobiae bacterium]